MDSFASALQVIDNQPLSLDRFRQHNCVLLTPVRSLHEGSCRKISVLTCNQAGGAENHERTSDGVAILKFIEDGLRYDDLRLDFSQNLDMSEQHEIVKG
jgi:hypothetical protein